MKKEINYLETFIFPDIPFQPYPVYDVSESGNIFNLRSIIYPSAVSAKKFTRKKQLKHRSVQAKIFDALINVGFWDPLVVIREFPIIIQNHLRLQGQVGSFILLDYYFPNLDLCIELDSELHKEDCDKVRDEYLEKNLGIKVFRIRNLERPDVQRSRFKELTSMMRGMKPHDDIRVFSFSDNIRLFKGL